MRVPSRRLLAAFTAFALTAVSAAVSAQTTPAEKPAADKPAVKPVHSIPYVSITGDDGRQRHYETNAIPLLFNRACFGWRMYLGGPNRTITLTEVLTTSQKLAHRIAREVAKAFGGKPRFSWDDEDGSLLARLKVSAAGRTK